MNANGRFIGIGAPTSDSQSRILFYAMFVVVVETGAIDHYGGGDDLAYCSEMAFASGGSPDFIMSI